jgi:hypothetical protein
MAVQAFQYQPDATCYVQIFDQTDQSVWNGSDFVTFADASWADYDLVCTELGTSSGRYQFTIPSDIPAGDYDWVAFVQAGGSPAVTDLAIRSDEFHFDGTSVADPDPTVDDEFGTRPGADIKAGGQTNLDTYLRQSAGSLQSTTVQNEIANAYESRNEEANVDMAMAWREYTDLALGYTETYEHRWLDDTADYGVVVKAWAGRNVSRGQTDDIPQQIATAIDEWTRRLEMLRTGTALQAYYDENKDEATEAPVGTFQSVPLTFNEDAGVVDEFSE